MFSKIYWSLPSKHHPLTTPISSDSHFLHIICFRSYIKSHIICIYIYYIYIKRIIPSKTYVHSIHNIYIYIYLLPRKKNNKTTRCSKKKNTLPTQKRQSCRLFWTLKALQRFQGNSKPMSSAIARTTRSAAWIKVVYPWLSAIGILR